MSTDADVLRRLDGLGLRWYVTGSWALAAYAEPRMTRDLDVVVDVDLAGYERRIRPAFTDAFLVNDPIDLGHRWMGGLIHRVEIARVDLLFGRDDAFARSAFERRVEVDHPGLGRAWLVSPEDLLLAKLEWSDGGSSELQLRDCRSLVRLNPELDWRYVEGFAAGLGLGALLEAVRDG